MKTTREVKYADSSHTLRFEMPESWDIPNISGVKVRFESLGGESLLALQDCTQISIEVLQSASLIGENNISLGAAQETALEQGDRLLINSSDSGPAESVVVNYYDVTNNVAYLVDDLREAHAIQTAVTAKWVTYAADFSGTTYTKGYQFRITWEPQGTDDEAYTEIVTVSGSKFIDTGFWFELSARYPTLNSLVDQSRRNTLLDVLRDDYRFEVMSFGFDVDRAVDTPFWDNGFQYFAHYKILTGTGDQWTEERKVAKEEWVAFVDRMRNLELWVDIRQDESLSDSELYVGQLFIEHEDF